MIHQMSLDHALHHLQHRRDQLGLCGQQHAQHNGQKPRRSQLKASSLSWPHSPQRDPGAGLDVGDEAGRVLLRRRALDAKPQARPKPRW